MVGDSTRSRFVIAYSYFLIAAAASAVVSLFVYSCERLLLIATAMVSVGVFVPALVRAAARKGIHKQHRLVQRNYVVSSLELLAFNIFVIFAGYWVAKEIDGVWISAMSVGAAIGLTAAIGFAGVIRAYRP